MLTKTQSGRIAEFLLMAQALYTSQGDVEPFSPATDDEEIDVCVQRRGQASALYIQVKSGYIAHDRGRVPMHVKISPDVFPVHPAFVYALLFIQPPGRIDTAWLIKAGDLLQLVGGPSGSETTVRSVYPHLALSDQFEPYRLTPADIGPRLLRFLEDVRQAEPPSKAARQAFAAT